MSREKSATVSKNLTKQISKKCDDLPNKPTDIPTNQDQDKKKDNLDVTKNDMGTQWESDELPNEWVPNVPVLSLHKDDSVKESLAPNTGKTDKSKRPNLFALSYDMPSSLRGGLTEATEEEPVHMKPSLTLVSEYLQNRNLRLREPQPSSSQKTGDLQTIKQTILHTRVARTDGKVFDSVCHVLDKQVIPVPSWQAEDFGVCPPLCQQRYYTNHLQNSLGDPGNKLHSSSVLLERNLQSSPAYKQCILQRRNKALYGACIETGDKVMQIVSSSI